MHTPQLESVTPSVEVAKGCRFGKHVKDECHTNPEPSP